MLQHERRWRINFLLTREMPGAAPPVFERAGLESSGLPHPSLNLCPARFPSPSYAAYLYISLNVG